MMSSNPQQQWSSKLALVGAGLVLCIIVGLFATSLLFLRAFAVPTGSMEKTIPRDSRILARTFHHSDPQHGDIVVFRMPTAHGEVSLKRITGLPGDRIKIVAQAVYRNGVALKEPYATHVFRDSPDKSRDNLPYDPADVPPFLGTDNVRALKEMFENHVVNGEVVVPPGKYFVLGDNRDESLDSRYYGFVDARNIIGLAVYIYGFPLKPI